MSNFKRGLGKTQAVKQGLVNVYGICGKQRQDIVAVMCLYTKYSITDANNAWKNTL
jgi:hypothetical protein